MSKKKVDLVIGSQANPTVVQELVSEVSALLLTDATLYVGYPILSTADESLSLDAILTSQEHGIVVFDIRSTAPSDTNGFNDLEDYQAGLEIALKSKLLKHKDLTERRQLVVPIHIVTFLPHIAPDTSAPEGIHLTDRAALAKTLESLTGIPPHLTRPLNAAVQQVTTIKPRKKRLNVTSDSSRGGLLRLIEKEIANLDRWQKRAAIECPEGPQRIRGLAGSGKTVVLALKAAYLHAQHPDWDIVVTFQTRSLYGQIRDLIRRFTFEHLQDEPNWDKVRVLHAWGSSGSPGLYSTIAKENECQIRSYEYAKTRFGSSHSYEGVCKELLKGLSESPKPLFDAVLVDEAQDFGPSFFQIVHRSLKNPKRLTWAYDDLQSLKETGIPNLIDLFGRDQIGQPLVRLENEDGKPHEDIILPVCYRNTPWALTIAHALGFGLYRTDGMIQCFDKPEFWLDIGYDVESGVLQEGQDVVLKRHEDATPAFFVKLLQPTDAVQIHKFVDNKSELHWVASEIKRNIEEEELDPSDILVVFANPLTVDKESGPLRAELHKYGIASHVAGVTRSADEFFIEGSVVISGIYRAKGNEAAIVYVVGSQNCYGSWGNSIRSRNILFTAITRSRAWVRVCGTGENMDRLIEEWNHVSSDSFRLRFRVPTESQRQQMRQIHRERTENELKQIRKGKKSLEDVVALIECDLLSIEDIPSTLRTKLMKVLNKGETLE